MSEWKDALDLETRVAQIIHIQERNGVGFDLERAIQYINDLEERCNKLYNEIRPYLRIEIKQYLSTVNKPFLKKGGYTKQVVSWYDSPDIVWGPFSKIVFEEPDLGSRQKLVKQLLEHGWVPELFTEKGTPKLTYKGKPVDSLFKIDASIGKAIAEWYVLKHRQSQITGWTTSVRDDGRISASANSCGTNTYRMRHKTVVNVPKADPSVIFGYEMRSLFIARPGYKLLGYDASALEARCMAHYTYKLDNGEFADLILNGDIHEKNAKIFFEEETYGLDPSSKEFKVFRSKGKNGTYCLMYGGQPRKLAETLNIPLSKAKILFEKFWRENEALGKLRDLTIKMHDRRGWVPGLDGRRIYTRSSHSALNAVFQSCGAIVMKRSMVLLNDFAKIENIHHYKVLDMHDEGQHEVLEEECYYVDDVLRHRLGELAILAFETAGTELKMNVPITGEYSIGDNWAETH